MNKPLDYLIVGQGLAGTLMAFELLQAGKNILVIDQGHEQAASSVAAGIINPITGRYFVKSWLFDDLRSVAVQTYRQLEKMLSVSFFHERQLLRVLLDAREANSWQSKSTLEAFQMHIVRPPQWGQFEKVIQAGVGLSETKLAGQVHMPILIRAFRQWLKDRSMIVEEAFEHEQLQIQDNSISYQGISAHRILFCEGQKGRFNPFFPALPFAVTKGEVLHCHIPSLNTQRLLKHKLMMAPLPPEIGPNRFWLGANYVKNPSDESTSPQGYDWLTERLHQMLKVPHNTFAHRAAIRPTTRDRRPLLGQHPTLRPLFLFNGLGTKGASLGPYFAKSMRHFLLQDQPLIPEVKFNRTFKKEKK